MSGKIARLVLILSSALALAACGSPKEAELAKQLAEAKAQAAEEASARKAAERDAAALRAKARDAALADFYAGNESDDSIAPDDAPPADSGAMPMNGAPQPDTGPLEGPVPAGA
ncbi:MAG: hypothetical protein P8Y58_03635 [Novosphingobium sp.]